MARICDVTGKKAMSGNNVSHAMNKTKRKFNVNLQKKRFFSEELNKWVTLKVSSAAMRTISKKGLDAVLNDIKK